MQLTYGSLTSKVSIIEILGLSGPGLEPMDLCLPIFSLMPALTTVCATMAMLFT